MKKRVGVPSVRERAAKKVCYDAGMSRPAPALLRVENAESVEQLTLFWESEVVTNADASVTLRAVVPLSHMTRRQAARALGCSEQVITDLFRYGQLEGYKPGGWRVRKDGKASNAKLRLCSGSVLRYKQARERAAKEWQARLG